MEWDKIEFEPFKTSKEEYVICLDSLGQDREFTDEQKRFALNTVKAFKEIWEKQEITSLTRDRDRKLELLNMDPELAQQKEDEYTADINDKMDLIEANQDYFAPPEQEKILYQEELEEIEKNQKRLTVEA